MLSTNVLRSDAKQTTLLVRVTSGGGETTHEVTLAHDDLRRLGKPDEDAAHFVERCFEFLLERESKESILPRFDLTVIARYFPEFESMITR